MRISCFIVKVIFQNIGVISHLNMESAPSMAHDNVTESIYMRELFITFIRKIIMFEDALAILIACHDKLITTVESNALVRKYVAPI